MRSLLLCVCLLPSLVFAAPGKHAVATAHPLATQAAIDILQQGGNAFDAAVAASAALAVVEPYGSGMGGGGFWLLHRAEDAFNVMIDGREKAPLTAKHDFYQTEQAKKFDRPSLNGPMAAGIPGQPAALAHIAERYGKLSLTQSLAPAIRLARQGFEVEKRYRMLMGFRLKTVQAWPETAKIFLLNNDVPPLGYVIKQPDLANTLEAMAKYGAAGFYQGEVSKALVRSVQQHGGSITQQDLDAYQVIERPPLIGKYQDQTIVTAAPPSAGGVGLINMFNMLEQWPWQKLAKADQVHLITQVMQRAYRDRALYLGDPDFVEIPFARLLSKDYAAGQNTSIRLDRHTPSESLAQGNNEGAKGRHTTHFSIIDAKGNRVAATLSINYPFGSGFVAEGTGVLLNDEMDDFATAQHGSNAYGLVDHGANRIEPGKRPLSSMTPTFVESDQGVAVLGTPGGSRIVTMVLLGVLEHLQGEPVQQWVATQRFHHQYLPDEIQFEKGGLTPELQQALKTKRHQLKEIGRNYGNMQAVFWNKKSGAVTAASDPRALGEARVVEP